MNPGEKQGWQCCQTLMECMYRDCVLLAISWLASTISLLARANRAFFSYKRDSRYPCPDDLSIGMRWISQGDDWAGNSEGVARRHANCFVLVRVNVNVHVLVTDREPIDARSRTIGRLPHSH